MKEYFLQAFVLCLLTLPGIAREEPPELFFEKITITTAAKNDPAVDIIKDAYGQMWFASAFDGLHKFDGEQFYNYKTSPNDSTSLPSNMLQKLFLDRDSTLWIGTRVGILSKYIPSSDSFKHFRIETRDERLRINDIVQTDDGRIWLATNEGLYYLNNDEELERYHNHAIQPVSSFLVTKSGDMFVGSTGKIFLLKDGVPHNAYYYPEPNAITNTIRLDKYGNIWAGTSKGLFILNPISGEFSHHMLDKIFRKSFGYVRDIMIAEDGKIWVISMNSGIFIFDDINSDPVQVKSKAGLMGSISDDRGFSLFQDEHEIIWISTHKGINKYDRYRIKFNTLRHNEMDPNSLGGRNIYSVYRDEDGILWAGTKNGKLTRYDRRKEKYDHRLINGPDGDPVLVLQMTTKDRAFIYGATTQGLVEINRETMNTRFIDLIPGYEHVKLRRIVPYGDKYFLLGSDVGLMILNDETGEISHYPFQSLDGKFIYRKNSVKSIYVDIEDRIWVGTTNMIHEYDFKTQRFTSLAIDDEFTYQFDNYLVMSIYRQKNTLWLGTFNAGLLALDLDKWGDNMDSREVIRSFTVRDGLPNRVVYAILPDGWQNLWLSTNQGISRFNISDSTFTNYTIEDGLQNNEFNMGVQFRARSGELYFGGVEGINHFFPSKINPNPHPPATYISGVNILNDWDQDKQEFRSINLVGKSRLELSYQKNFVNFHFRSTHLSAPDEVSYAYMLEGVDKDWVFAGHENHATYTNLDPGSYTFLVKSANPDGVWSEQQSSLDVVIDAPFWRTPWFYTLCGMGLIGILILIVSQKAFNERRLKQVIGERTSKIRKQKDIIEKQYKELKASEEKLKALNNKKDFIFSILSHDIRSPLTTLKGFLNILGNSYANLSGKEVKMFSKKINDSVSNSLDLIDNTLYWSLAQMGNLNFNPQVISLNPIIDKSIDLYKLTAEKKFIEIKCELSEDLRTYADENMMFLVIRNLISNAVKFTPLGGSIDVTSFVQNGNVAFSVIDSGVGIDEDNITRIFNPNETYTTRGTSDEKGTGLGLTLCKSFVEQNNGNIVVESSLGKGTEFKVVMPTADKVVVDKN